MKKIVVLLLTLIMLCSIPIASATSLVIRFRGLTWGLSIDAVQKAITSDMLPFFTQADERAMIYPSGIANSSQNEWVRTKGNCGFMCTMVSENSYVGGYIVNRIALAAHYGEKNNTISMEPSDSVFYLGAYYINTLNVDDIASVFFDLQGKLTYLYGEYEEFKAEDTYTTTWFGTKDTAVSLVHDDGEIMIVYYKNNYDEKLASIEKKVSQMIITEKYKNSDLSGL